MIETTVNLDLGTYLKLYNAAKYNNLKMKDVVHVLFKLMLIERPLPLLNFKRVRYQEKIEGSEWKIFHLLLLEGSYETCIDLRKLFKISVSGILGIAVELYLERVIESMTKKNDNYPENYVILKNSTSPLPSYTVFYELPPQEILDYYLPIEKT